MARLSAAERAKLPDSAFAYVDSTGKRRLPIHDASHVRNALARFSQVRFERDVERDEARQRLLKAAKRHGIVPIGFIDSELRSARTTSRAGRLVIELSRVETSAHLQSELRRTLGDPGLTILRWSKRSGTYVDCVGDPVALPGESPGAEPTVTFLQGAGRPLMAVVHAPGLLAGEEISDAVLAAVHLVAGRELLDEVDDMGVATEGLPEGTVTFLLTDVEGSTALVHALGGRYVGVLDDVRAIIRDAVLGAAGRQVEARADEFVAVFEEPSAALTAAVRLQDGMSRRTWPSGSTVRVRAGLHTGPITLADAGYVGITVHAAARIMSVAGGGQILASSTTVEAAGPVEGVRTRPHGEHRLRGLTEPVELVEVHGGPAS